MIHFQFNNDKNFYHPLSSISLPGPLCRLLSKESVVQKALGKHIKLECVVGLNGRVWITGQALMQIIVVRNCILASEYMGPQAIQEMVDEAVLL